MMGHEGGRERHSKDGPPIPEVASARLELEERCLDLLDALIAAHGKDNTTGMREDIPPKIAAQLKRRR